MSPQATINIVFDRVGKTDPVTRGIEITVNYLGIQFDVRVVSWCCFFLFYLLKIITKTLTPSCGDLILLLFFLLSCVCFDMFVCQICKRHRT